MALPLKTRRLEIRELEPSDFSAVHACASDSLVARWFPWGPNTEEETREFLDRAAGAAKLPDRQNFALGIALHGGGLIGVCFLDRRQDREFEIGYYLRRDHWRRGFATESLKAVVSFAFGRLGAHRIVARIDPANPASARVAECVGFRCEASQERFIKGERREVLVYLLPAAGCAD